VSLDPCDLRLQALYKASQGGELGDGSWRIVSGSFVGDVTWSPMVAG
jgi:hypothetical protein